MSNQNDDAPVGLTDTLTVADSLRQVADWLDEHPEIAVRHSFVSIATYEREHLEVLAAALGDRAREREVYGPDVEIRGTFGSGSEFGGTQVYGSVPIAKLTGAPVKPEYRPILADLDAATGEGRR
jgi:hypothetical protein